LSPLSFEAFDLEDHFGGDDPFLVEHGIGEGGFGDGADFSWDAEGDLMDGIEGFFIEDGFLCAGELEVVGHVIFGLIGAKARHMVTDSDPLVEGLHDGKLHGPSEVGLA
jgi:hypothetical protein